MKFTDTLEEPCDRQHKIQSKSVVFRHTYVTYTHGGYIRSFVQKITNSKLLSVTVLLLTIP